MRILDTGVPDVDVKNIDESKLELSNKIIKMVYPLLDELYSDRQKKISNLKEELEKKTIRVTKEKNDLEQLVINHNKQQKINKLLERISRIISSGLANSGSYRHETIILLRVIDTLSNDKLNYHLSETIKTINKRFSVSINETR